MNVYLATIRRALREQGFSDLSDYHGGLEVSRPKSARAVLTSLLRQELKKAVALHDREQRIRQRLWRRNPLPPDFDERLYMRYQDRAFRFFQRAFHLQRAIEELSAIESLEEENAASAG